VREVSVFLGSPKIETALLPALRPNYVILQPVFFILMAPQERKNAA
jgi:hypothetical protein